MAVNLGSNTKALGSTRFGTEMVPKWSQTSTNMGKMQILHAKFVPKNWYQEVGTRAVVPEPIPWNRRNRGFGTGIELKNKYSYNTTRTLRKLTVSALLVALGGEALDLSLVAVLSSVYSSDLSL